jgi:pilus assembly protein CpaB
MARRFMMALLVALIISGSAVYFLSRKMSHAHSRPEALAHYVGAARVINPGTVLSAKDLTTVSWPASHPLAGSFLKVDDVVGRTVLYPLAAGEPVLDHELAPKGSALGITARIPEGMRAVALHSDEVVGVAGFLMPGTHVDVLVTYRSAAQSEPITATVIQDVEVLAVGHQLEPDPSGKPANVSVVTLLLTPAQAQKAVLAAAQGSIHFELRNGTDTAPDELAPIGLGQLASASGSSYPPKSGSMVRTRRQAAPPAPKPWVVETLLGTKRTEASFSGGGHD